MVSDSMRGVNRYELLVPVSFLSGVQAPPASRLAHRYSWEFGRRDGGVLSQSTRRSGGGFIFEQSAKLLTRLYKNVPVASLRA